LEADPGRRGPPGSGVPEDDDFVGAAGDDGDDEEDESDDDDGEEDEEEEGGDGQAPACLRLRGMALTSWICPCTASRWRPFEAFQGDLLGSALVGFLGILFPPEKLNRAPACVPQIVSATGL